MGIRGVYFLFAKLCQNSILGGKNYWKWMKKGGGNAYFPNWVKIYKISKKGWKFFARGGHPLNMINFIWGKNIDHDGDQGCIFFCLPNYAKIAFWGEKIIESGWKKGAEMHIFPIGLKFTKYQKKAENFSPAADTHSIW